MKRVSHHDETTIMHVGNEREVRSKRIASILEMNRKHVGSAPKSLSAQSFKVSDNVFPRLKFVTTKAECRTEEVVMGGATNKVIAV